MVEPTLRITADRTRPILTVVLYEIIVIHGILGSYRFRKPSRLSSLPFTYINVSVQEL